MAWRRRFDGSGRERMASRLLSRIGAAALFLIAAVFAAATAHGAGPTLVIQDITQDTRWTAADSPYLIGRDITVHPGATLTVEPGAVVLFQKVDAPKAWTRRAVLRVMGTLRSIGTAREPILYSLQDAQEIGGWGGIWIDGFFGGVAEIAHSRIEYAERGIYASNSPVEVRDSILTMNFTALYVENTQGFIVEGNNFSRNEYGVYLAHAGGEVSRNTIVTNTWGVYIFDGRGAEIAHNDIKGNTFGIIYDGGAHDAVRRNDFSVRSSNHYVFLIRSGKPAILEENNFYFDEGILADPGAVFWFLFNEVANDEVPAPNNYWSSTNTGFIDTFIYDKKDDPWVGLVSYDPIRAEPVTGTIDDTRPPEVHILASVRFSPNGDGVLDTAEIPYSLSEHALRLVVEIIDFAGRAGPAGAVIWSASYEAGGPHDAYLRDGSHTVAWDGTMAGAGAVVPEGTYLVRIRAYDLVDTATYGEAERELTVDVSPPVLEVDAPVHQSVTSFSQIEVVGRVKDADPSGISVTVNGSPAHLFAAPGEWTGFTGEAVLIDEVNAIVVEAVDAAGNRDKQTILVGLDAALSLDLTSPTNQEAIAARGRVFDPAITTIEARVRTPSGAESDPVVAPVVGAAGARTYESAPSLLLGRGRNLVVAVGRDASGDAVGSAAAWVEYDPFAAQSLEHTFPPGLAMITVPLFPDTTDPKQALGVAGELKLARWQAPAGEPRYVRYDAEPLTLEGFAPGRGFWLELDPAEYPGGLRAAVEGTIADTTRDWEIPIRPGWNLIGNPFLEPIPWRSVQVQLPGGRPVSWQTAVQSGWLRAGLWSWDGASYRLAETLLPWAGYWVKATRELTLVVRPPGVLASAMAPLAAPRSGPGGDGEWTIRMSARGESWRDEDNRIGVSREASAGFDRLHDVEEPPAAAAGPRSRLYVAGEASALAVDMRGTLEGPEYVWPLVLETEAAGEVELSWTGVRSLPPGAVAVLIDEERGRRIDMQRTSSVVLDVAEAGVRPLAVHVFATDALTLDGVLAYPNPTDLSSPVRIRAHLSAEALVSAGVYDTAGRRVRRLPQVQAGPGPVILEWDGRDAAGRQAANGLYFVRIYAERGGERIRATARVAVLK